jgi:hypothetical protein
MFDLLVYLADGDNALAVRDRYRKAFPDARVACRSARHYAGEVESCRRVACQRWPGIARAYQAAGISVLNDDALPTVTPCQPEWITELPRADELTVLSASPFAEQSLAAYGTHGPVIAVNTAACLHPADWWVALDGFSELPPLVPGNPIQCTISAFLNTCFCRRYFHLATIGIDSTGIFSSTAALRLARAMKPRLVHLVGHDCAPGLKGYRAGYVWHDRHLHSLAKQIDAEIAALVADGCEVRHVRWTGQGVETTSHAPITTPPFDLRVMPDPARRRRKAS